MLCELVSHTFVSLRGSLKCVLVPESEHLAVAMCELNSLADIPLGFENVKVISELHAQRECQTMQCETFGNATLAHFLTSRARCCPLQEWQTPLL